MGHADARQPDSVCGRRAQWRLGVVLPDVLLRVAGAPPDQDGNVDGAGAQLWCAVSMFRGVAGVQAIPSVTPAVIHFRAAIPVVTTQPWWVNCGHAVRPNSKMDRPD